MSGYNVERKQSPVSLPPEVGILAVHRTSDMTCLEILLRPDVHDEQPLLSEVDFEPLCRDERWNGNSRVCSGNVCCRQQQRSGHEPDGWAKRA